MSHDIEHKGSIIDIVDNRIDVAIESHSACGSCKVKSLCGMSENEQKVVSVYEEFPQYFEIGQVVDLSIAKSMGMKAVTLAYIFPFFVLIGTLLIFSGIFDSELVFGSLALAATALYYIVLWFFRHKIEREIIFKIKKS